MICERWGQLLNFSSLTGADGKDYPAKTPEAKTSPQTEMGGLFNRKEAERKSKAEDAKKLQDEAPAL